MMYRVVIIDDEPIIVEGLSKAVDWTRWDCRVVGTALDGVSGRELIRAQQPDIIISDIRMPGMSGLKMVAAIKGEFPYTQITILTGYSDFEYAREAIRLGVSRYLLKPSRIDELEEAIGAMKEHLDEISEIHPELFSGAEPVRHQMPELQESEEETEQVPAEDISPEEDEMLHSPANSFIVNNAMDYIREHYAEKLRLSDVADEIFVSQWHLSKLLNRHMNSSFSELLNGIRIEKAKELLKDPSLRIYDIAEQVGFTDLTHFSRVFKKLEGISANEYRNRI